MAPDPKLVFIRVDVGDHMVVGQSNSAAKSRSSLKNPVCLVFSTRLAGRRCLSSSPIVSPPDASESSCTEALSRYQARNEW